MLRSILAAALDVLAPETCAFCRGSRRGKDWFLWPGPGATGLRPWDAPHLCRACFESRAGDLVVGAVAERPLLTPLATSSELTRAVGLWKYHGVRGLGAPLAAWLATVLEQAGSSTQVSVVPVPLHRARRRARGFDQVVDLARLAAILASSPLALDVLWRRRATRQQASHDTAGAARAENVAGAFTCRPPRAREPRELLLVDDLATTGATLAAAAGALVAAGWTVVGCAALGQARRLMLVEGLDTGGIPPQSVARTDATCFQPVGAARWLPGLAPGGMMKKANLAQLDPAGRKILMRVDFNVPLDANRLVTDDTRIRAALPSLAHILDGGGSVILMSHLGRPKGEVKAEYSLRPVADRLAELITAPVKFASDTVGLDARSQAANLAPGEVLLLENVRFDPGETKNDPSFSQALAELGDAYVNDAFGTAHRAHASTVGAARHFDQRLAGLLMQKELDHLGGLLHAPRRPFTAILGGAKVDSKVDVIRHLLDQVDHLLLGGGMIFTFFKVMGLNIGDSLLDTESLPVAEAILEQAKSSRGELVLPTDIVVSTDFSANGEVKTVLATDIPDGWQGLDIGPDSVARYVEVIGASRALFWNGPMGVFEIDRFAGGTRAVGEALVAATGKGAESVVGGGDSVAALNQLGLAAGVTHVSTGGGASLEFMAGQALPGVEALSDA